MEQMTEEDMKDYEDMKRLIDEAETGLSRSNW
jgi:hypothetical protein